MCCHHGQQLLLCHQVNMQTQRFRHELKLSAVLRLNSMSLALYLPDESAYLTFPKQSIDRLPRYLAITLCLGVSAVAVLYKEQRQSSHAAPTTGTGFTIQACVNMRSTTRIMFSAGYVKITIPLGNTGARRDSRLPQELPECSIR